MAITDKKELVKIVKSLMGASYDKVSDDGFSHAINQACMELHWSPPLTDETQSFWLIERAKRFVIEVLLVESANKFRYKDIHLHNRFAHYIQLIKMQDARFEKAVDEAPQLFDVGSMSNFCVYISNTFVYDDYGRDISWMYDTVISDEGV